MKKDDTETKFNSFSLHSAAYSVGLVLLLSSSGAETLPFVKILEYSIIYYFIGAIVVILGAVIPTVIIHESDNKWWKIIKLLGSFICMAFVYSLIAGYIK